MCNLQVTPVQELLFGVFEVLNDFVVLFGDFEVLGEVFGGGIIGLT